MEQIERKKIKQMNNETGEKIDDETKKCLLIFFN
jgi:hypothetical protein